MSNITHFSTENAVITMLGS